MLHQECANDLIRGQSSIHTRLLKQPVMSTHLSMEYPSGQAFVAQWISLPGASMKPHFEHKDADLRDEELGYGWGTFPLQVLNS